MIKILKGKIKPKSRILLKEAIIFFLVNIFIFFLFNSNIGFTASLVENNKNSFKSLFSVLDYLKFYFSNFFKIENKNEVEKKALDFILKLEEQKKEIEKSLNFKDKFRIVEISWINNKGEIFLRENLKNGFLLTSDFILVGKVFKFSENVERIRSVLEPNFEFNVAKENGEFLGLAKTLGLGLLEINLSLDKEIKEGDYIFTGGKDGIFKAGFLVGKVVKIKEGLVNKKVLLKSLFEPTKEHYLVLVYD